MRQRKALGKVIETLLKPKKKHRKDIDVFLSAIQPEVKRIIEKLVRKLGPIKVQFALNVRLKKHSVTDKRLMTTEPWFCSTSIAFYAHGKCRKIRKSLKDISGRIDTFVELGSGWTLSKVLSLRVKAIAIQSFRGGKPNNTLPQEIKMKKAVISVNCPEDQCFAYSVLAGVHKFEKNPQRKSLYNLSELNCQGIQFPVAVKQISIFEKNNDISINVFVYHDQTVIPAYVTCHRQKKDHVNLLLHDEHYYWIRNMSRLLSGQQFNCHKQKRFLCDFCLCTFSTQERLDLHSPYCQHGNQRYVYPPPGSRMKFTNYARITKAPFVIYADFESINEKIHDHKAKTLRKTRHIPVSICALRVSSCDRFCQSTPFVYRGQDCVEKFLEYLDKQQKKIDGFLSNPTPMIWDAKAKEKASKQKKKCYICKRKLRYSYERARDHCHLSGKFRGIACLRCNLKYSSTYHMRTFVVMHNCAAYDLHFIVESLNKVKRQVSIIPRNTEKFVALAMDSFVFIDSYNFLNESLGNWQII